jgi:VPDSG-CTERM motif
MKRYVLCAFAVLALALNAQAEPKDKDKDKPPKDKDVVYYVPDNGSTALLLGMSLLALGVTSRRFATR